MDDDDFDDVGFQANSNVEDGDHGICEFCGSSRLKLLNDGDVICLDCGTRNEHGFQLVQEEADLLNVNRTATGAIFQRDRTSDGKKAVKISYDEIFATKDFLSALQLILLEYSTTLINKLSFPHEFTEVLKSLWLRYLSNWSQFKSSPISLVNYKLRTSDSLMHMASLQFLTLKPVPIVPISMPLLLSFLHLACRWLSLPITCRDLHMLARNGTLLYTNAFKILSKEIQVQLAPAESFLSPLIVPNVQTLEKLGEVLSHNLGILDILPRENKHLIGLTRINILQLPFLCSIPLLSMLVLFEEIDARDEQVRPSKMMRHSRTVPVEARERFHRLKKAADVVSTGLSPSLIAALCIVSLRCTNRWEDWVDIHVNKRPRSCESKGSDLFFPMSNHISRLKSLSPHELEVYSTLASQATLFKGDIGHGLYSIDPNSLSESFMESIEQIGSDFKMFEMKNNAGENPDVRIEENILQLIGSQAAKDEIAARREKEAIDVRISVPNRSKLMKYWQFKQFWKKHEIEEANRLSKVFHRFSATQSDKTVPSKPLQASSSSGSIGFIDKMQLSHPWMMTSYGAEPNVKSESFALFASYPYVNQHYVSLIKFMSAHFDVAEAEIHSHLLVLEELIRMSNEKETNTPLEQTTSDDYISESYHKLVRESILEKMNSQDLKKL
jgi:hypothetical protein